MLIRVCPEILSRFDGTRLIVFYISSLLRDKRGTKTGQKRDNAPGRFVPCGYPQTVE